MTGSSHPPTPREIRAELEELVVGDLYGPAGGDEHERFPTYERVTDRYILGRLAPNGALIDPNDQDRFAESGVHDTVSMADADTDGDAEPEAPSAASMFCNAHGFTVCGVLVRVPDQVKRLVGHFRSLMSPEGPSDAPEGPRQPCGRPQPGSPTISMALFHASVS